MILYRPVGLQELELIYDNGMKAFPARLPQQPIFYPVLDLEYARQTASSYNAKSGQFAGYVTQFKVEDKYLDKFEKHTVGKSKYQEFWIPAEELEEFNKHLLGHIKVIEAHFGSAFQGFVPEKFGLQGKNAVAQFTELANIFVYKRMDFYLEIKRNHKAVFLNYPFWLKHEFKNQSLKEKVLQGIKEAWLTSFPKIPLAIPVQEEVASAAPIKSPDVEQPKSEETPLVTPARARFTIKPENHVAPPRKQVDPPSTTPSAPKETPSIKPVSLPPPAKNTPENTTPEKPPEPRVSIHPIQENPLPANPGVSHFSQGVALGLSGKYQEAVAELTQSVQGNPRHVGAQTSLGVAFRRLGQEDRALSCYEAALKLDPSYAEAHYFRANILYSQGNIREAIAEYTTALGLKPELIEAHQKPVPQDRLTDYSDAPAGVYRIARHASRILELNKLIEANPQQSPLFKERASEYSRLGNFEQAISDYEACLAIQPDDAAALHLRGLAYEQMGQSDRASKDYKQAISANPQLSNEYIERGVKFGNLGQFRQSIDSLTEGIRLAPGNPNGYFNRGATYLRWGDLEKAIADFSMVIQLSSKDEEAYYWRGISYEEAGHQKEAAADYERFLELSQDPGIRNEIKQKLNQWIPEKQPGSNSPSSVPSDKQKTDPFASEQTNQEFDLYGLIVALGERALKSTWFGSDVDCEGEKAEELYSYTDNQKPIPGDSLLAIATGIHKTFEGDFTVFDPDASVHWLFIRAWNGSGFYIETNDDKIKNRLKAYYQLVEEIEGVSPPYEGLFINI